MSNIQYNTSTATTATEEPKYPEREFALDRMSAKERNSGSICFKFAHEFRQSNFYFSFSLSQQRDQILLPPRSSLIQHIQEVSPNYQFPSCLSNKDLTVERKIKKSADDENAEIIKFEYKKTTITADEEAEEDLEEHEDQEGGKKDSDSENQEEYSEEDLIGDFDINRYNDNETGEDNDDDDGDDDDD